MRPLRTHELELLKALLEKAFDIAEQVIPTLDTVLVEEADDGKMGGIIFKSCIDDVDRVLGRIVAEADFLDEDGIPVSIELNLDKDSQLFELDVWKVDYSPVCRWPDISQIVIK